MKTFQLKKEEVLEKWYLIDAKDQIVGRLAGSISRILRGKHRPEFTPHTDGGDHVVVINCEKIKMTGKKNVQKKYRHYSGYIGGLKTISYQRMLDRHPERILRNAVKGMLAKNRLQACMLKKLKIYPGQEHPHLAQKPEVYSLAD